MNKKSALQLMDRDRWSETGKSIKSQIRRPRFITACLPNLTFDGNRVRAEGDGCVFIYVKGSLSVYEIVAILTISVATMLTLVLVQLITAGPGT